MAHLHLVVVMSNLSADRVDLRLEECSREYKWYRRVHFVNDMTCARASHRVGERSDQIRCFDSSVVKIVIASNVMCTN